MDKQQFLDKWKIKNIDCIADLDAVIAHEIAKVWELEPVQGIPQPEPTEQPAKPFDRDRFEAMFRAVVASGRTERWEQDFKFTEEALAKLDAYYASKEGGNTL